MVAVVAGMSTLRHPDWHWIARQVFRKRALVRVSYQWFDAKPYVVLSDPVLGAHVRLSAEAEQLWRAIDGSTSMQAIWDHLRAQQRKAPTQDELVSWVVQLVQQGFLLSDHPLDADALAKRQEKRLNAQIEQRLASPLAIKTRLFDPHRLTQALWPWVSRVFTRSGAWLFIGLLVSAVITGAMHGPQLLASADDSLLSQSGLLMLLICYPMMKVVHEFAHCWMVYRFGGQVREFGIMWLVFFPVPYVEASEASAFTDKRARMLVGAAGIMAEIGMASAAMLIWPWIEPGVVRAFLYQIIIIGTVSTLLFNGNPLLKFDAYFVLADALEIPNLAKRSADYVRETLFFRLAGVRRTLAVSPREAAIFRVYGPLSLLYRVGLTLAIAWLAMSWFYIVGLALALWAVVTGIAWPFGKSVVTGFKSAYRQHQLPKASRRSLLWLAAFVGLGGLVPLPFFAHGQGQWVVADQALIVADGSGPVTRVWVANGQRVEASDPLLKLDDPQLRARAEALEISRRFLGESLSRGGLSANERSQLRQQQAVVEETAADFSSRLQALTLYASQAGQVQWNGGRPPHTGTFVTRGQALGALISASGMEVALAFPAQYSGFGAEGSTVSVRLLDGTEQTLPIVRSRVVDIGGTLPRAVAISGGGAVAEDPANPGTALEPVWLVWATATEDLTRFLGTRVDARLSLGDASLFRQLAFHLRQLFARALRL